MKLNKLLMLLSIGLIAAACTDSNEGIPVLGYDDRGRLVTERVTAEKYTEEMSRLIQDVGNSTLTTLEGIPELKRQNLESVSIGLGLNVKFKVPVLVTLAAGSRLRLTFANNENPDLP